MGQSDDQLIDDWFSYHAPSEKQRALLEEYRARFKSLAHSLVLDVENSRERAIALTELRKVAMVVNQAIIFDRSLV